VLNRKSIVYPRITFGIIVKNEEILLSQCLESIKELANEIIVVKSDSNDRTLEIAHRYNARIFNSRYNNLAALRNIYLKKAKYDWIFTLDADERIAKRDVHKIRSLTKNKKITAYSFISRLYTRHYDLLYDWLPCSGEYPDEEVFSGCPGYIDIDWGIRLFRNIKGLRYEGIIHETIDQCILRNGGRIINANIPIHHFKVIKTREANQKIAKYRFELEKKINFEIFKDNYRYYFRMGRDYLMLEKNYGKALACLKKSLQLKPDFVYSYFLLALIYKKKRLYQEATLLLKKALRIKKAYVGAHYLLGLIYDLMGKLKLSENEFFKALDINPVHPIVLNSLGVVLVKQGRVSQAMEYFKKAIEIYPAFRIAQNNLKSIESLIVRK
jgi:glycosyltransferase involved in cell wall biosynthesis